MDPSNVVLPLYLPSRDGACLTRVSYNIEKSVPNQARAGMAVANLSISLFGRISFVMFRRRIRNSRSQSALRSAHVVQITDPEDARVTLYKARSQRDCTTFDMQVRDLAEAAMQSCNLALNLEYFDVPRVFLFFNLSLYSSQWSLSRIFGLRRFLCLSVCFQRSDCSAWRQRFHKGWAGWAGPFFLLFLYCWEHLPDNTRSFH